MSRAYALITGGAGMLALALAESLERAGQTVLALSRNQLDVTNEQAVHRIIAEVRPRVVIQCAAYTRVDHAEADEARAFSVNATAVAHVAAACKHVGARLVYPSTDYVFDGAARKPYLPHDVPNPVNAYGRSKLAGEQAARAAGDYLIVRTSWLYGRGGRNFVRTVADKLKKGEPLTVVNDQTGAPTWAPDLADAVIRHLNAGVASGIYHCTNRGETTWYEVALEIGRILQLDTRVVPCGSDEYATEARRPSYSVLAPSADATVNVQMRSWLAALEDALKTSNF